VDRDVSFTDADHSLDDQIDAAYRSTYRRYALDGLADQSGLSMAELALAWVLRRPEAASAITGAPVPSRSTPTRRLPVSGWRPASSPRSTQR
jgi:hypothetical protein